MATVWLPSVFNARFTFPVFVLIKHVHLRWASEWTQGNMGITCVSSRTICHSSSGQKWRYLVLGKQGLERRLLPWQHHRGYHFVSYLMYITGAKFEWHQWNISWFYWFCDLYSYLNYLWHHQFLNKNLNERRSFKKERAILTRF